MFNLNFLLKLANQSAIISLFAILLAFGASLHNSSAHAGPIPVFQTNSSQITRLITQYKKSAYLKTQNNHARSISNRAIQHALKHAEDGTTYAWKHNKIELRGRVKPVSTYKNQSGQICRHVQFSLYAQTIKKRSNVLACQNKQGQWIVKS